ncbi:MAG: LPXTG cell wall anchor domain-containing protein [Lachnospiraceae bacterium]|nr:LPXTG cell wall anchor domain-containing protein [Lachnospiraceae bacterium]
MKNRKILRRCLKRCAAVLFAAGLLTAMSVTAFAAEVIDADRTGSISVTMQDASGTVVEGGSLALYQVAVVYVDETLQNSYELTEDFTDSGVDLDELSDEALAETLEAYADSEALDAYQTAEIGEDGAAVFTELPVGIYLVVQTEAADGYELVSSFVVTVPLSSDGTLIYDVDASPKVEAAEEIPEAATVEETTEEETTEADETPDDETEVKKSSVLPQTGAILWPIALMAGGGFVLLCAGGMLTFRKKGQ